MNGPHSPHYINYVDFIYLQLQFDRVCEIIVNWKWHRCNLNNGERMDCAPLSMSNILARQSNWSGSIVNWLWHWRLYIKTKKGETARVEETLYLSSYKHGNKPKVLELLKIETKMICKQITSWNVVIVSCIKTLIHYFKLIVIKIKLVWIVSLVVDRNFHIGICYITSNNGRRSNFLNYVSIKVKFCF